MQQPRAIPQQPCQAGELRVPTGRLPALWGHSRRPQLSCLASGSVCLLRIISVVSLWLWALAWTVAWAAAWPTLKAQNNATAAISKTVAVPEIRLQPGELYIEYKPGDSGLHLWVENKAGIGSILITDHTDDPAKKQHVYALRAASYNIYNGDEKRLLEGRALPSSLHSLIDSTPESNPYFPRGAFHIFIPFTVVYGYPWSRSGSKNIGKGSWLNIRTFRKPYGDYSGAFQDNPFVLSMSRLPEKAEEAEGTKEPPADEELSGPPLIEEEEKPAAAISALSNIDQKIDDLMRNNIDVALVLDTTISMRDNVEFLRSELIPLVKQKVARFDSFRIGVVLYRDYGEEYLVKPFEFNSDLGEVQKLLDGIRVRGGGDKPEAVYEGIYAALTDLKWQSTKRLVIQVGDAPPHPKPKGKVTETMVLAKSQEMLVQLQQINLEDIESEHDSESLAEDRARLSASHAAESGESS